MPLFSTQQLNCLSDHPDTAALERCLAGPRPSCACADDECPTSASDCYPEGDCPREVIEAAGADAHCIRVAPEEFGLGQSDAQQCMCGCARCASVCDGQGPVIGVLSDSAPMYAYPAIDLSRRLPGAGKVGLYVRARGVSNVGLVLATGDYDKPETLMSRTVYFMTTPLDDFTEQVFYGADFIGNKEPYAWIDDAGKPTTLLLVNTTPSGQGTALTFYELDCIIPFWVP